MFIPSSLRHNWRYLIALVFLFVMIAGRVVASSSSDAIAIRVVLNNLNHYSPLRWYKEQKFTGAPQPRLIDGYEAIRDGRTVYVNAANVLDTNNDGIDEFYTNIYLISYNQNAANATLDIFDQMLNHWKFNSNLITADVCQVNHTTSCLIDSDCPKNDYCLSRKAKATRDTKRLADLENIKIALEDYKLVKEHYPALNAGSYLANKTISVWPSWKTLTDEIGYAMTVDPINKLGPCGADYNQITCWNEKEKKFADPSADNTFNLPEGSRAYVYTTNAGGASFNLCANMELGSIVPGGCSGNVLMNNPPIIQVNNLASGQTGKKYSSFIKANDPDGDMLSWKIDTASAVWTGWSAPPILKNTGTNNQKEIYADQAGAAGIYNIAVIVKDNRGGEAVKEFTINIKTCTDGDGDGYYLKVKGDDCAPIDCDDTKNFIHPGATESCDTLDNNCDGHKDEGCDDDGDGFCDNSLKIYNNTSMCHNTKFIDDGINGDDCDDTRANIYPGSGCELTHCGDGQIQTNPQNDDGIAETCDDGNIVSGDGCDKNCQIE